MMTQHDGEQEQRTRAPNGQAPSEQPDWRREFPIDVPEDDYVARREFTRFLGLTSLAFLVGQCCIAVASWFRARQPQPEPKPIARLADLPTKGAALTFAYPEEQDTCLLVRIGDGDEAKAFRAFDQKCTHLSCAVVPEAEKNCLQCPCHKGTFDLETGRPVAGPPRRPLPRIELEVRDGVLYATGVELRTV